MTNFFTNYNALINSIYNSKSSPKRKDKILINQYIIKFKINLLCKVKIIPTLYLYLITAFHSIHVLLLLTQVYYKLIRIINFIGGDSLSDEIIFLF